ncbi:L-fuconolactonase [Jannaschia faecimaris]|uniref:L-fuconolactonase n=1 Tax=Jannaschia faecimaris TaxID=1244108 RepID=A0A1H3JPH5_9RHOB|nr:amidohydrolase family protein [Jannaschia faecimaris]SDY41268.1 L-fuconolactonase [Jannaschia faecimaris]
MTRIDAHQHFWRVDRGDYHWMDHSVARIRRDILPPDLEPHLARHDIAGTILVQAAQTEAETQFLLELARRTPFVRGVVGWADLEAPDLTARLDGLNDPKLRGLRPMLQDIAETEWLARPAVVDGLRLIAAKGLRLDALVQPRHLIVLADIAARIPTLPIVIDHCAKPIIAGGADPGDVWRADMARLAALPWVFCKISGLANEVGPGWTVDDLRPTLDHVLSVFGPDRVMWGSDWPVLDLAGNYDRWVDATGTLLAPFSEEARAQVMGGTAARFYGVSSS